MSIRIKFTKMAKKTIPYSDYNNYLLVIQNIILN